ncbi:hypothetical protein Micbo1qcDRAFT_205705 [Microdochium bolleyi]|uniref:Apple domain-containing protein n=1 Tax=Microdochium bolleyi TaxID=196109 RepID=A0A136IYS5_9PEZI|nr:hypothetical protein Micbo1qcDRAFT_205705 [Microdochium bolleyi]
MRVATLAVAALVVENALAAACGSEYYSSPVFGLAKQCAPGGYYDSPTYTSISTPADLSRRCDDVCDANARCVGYIATLSKASPSSAQVLGRCYFYASFPSLALKCSDSPVRIWGRLRDSTNQCLTRSASAASAYCSARLGTLAAITSTTTVTPGPTSTATEYLLGTGTTSTVIAISCVAAPQKARGEAAVDAAHQPGATARYHHGEARTAVAAPSPARAPACLNTRMAAAKISSACSCLGIATPAAPASTVTTTVTAAVPDDATRTITGSTTTYFEHVTTVLTARPTAFALKVRLAGDSSAEAQLGEIISFWQVGFTAYNALKYMTGGAFSPIFFSLDAQGRAYAGISEQSLLGAVSPDGVLRPAVGFFGYPIDRPLMDCHLTTETTTAPQMFVCSLDGAVVQFTENVVGSDSIVAINGPGRALDLIPFLVQYGC